MSNNIAYMQVLEIINLLPQEQKKLIPKNILDNLIFNTKGEKTILEYDKYGNLILTQKAKSIIIYLFKNYINHDKQLDKALNKKLQENLELNRVLKNYSNKINIKDNIFEKMNNTVDNHLETNKIDNDKDSTKNQLAIVSKPNLLKRLIQKIISIFKK